MRSEAADAVAVSPAAEDPARLLQHWLDADDSGLAMARWCLRRLRSEDPPSADELLYLHALFAWSAPGRVPQSPLLLARVAADPSCALPLLLRNGHGCPPALLLAALASLMQGLDACRSQEQASLRLLRAHFLLARLPLPELGRSPRLMRLLDHAGDGALIPLFLHRLDTLAVETSAVPDSAVTEGLHFLATHPSDAAERSAFADRLVSWVDAGRIPEPEDMEALRASATGDEERSRRVRQGDHRYLELLRSGDIAEAAALAQERALASRDPALSTAWLTRTLLLLNEAEAAPSVLAPVARLLAGAATEAERSQPTLYRFALEVEAAALRALGDPSATGSPSPGGSNEETPAPSPDLRRILAVEEAAASGIPARFQSALATWLPTRIPASRIPSAAPAQRPAPITASYSSIATERDCMDRAEREAFDAATTLLDREAWPEASDAFLALATRVPASALQQQLLRLASAAAALDGDEARALACLDRLPEELAVPATSDMLRLLLRHGRLERAAALLPAMPDIFPAAAREALLRAAAAAEAPAAAREFLLRALTDHPDDEPLPPRQLLDEAFRGPDPQNTSDRMRSLLLALLPAWSRRASEAPVFHAALEVALGLLGDPAPLLDWVRDMPLEAEARALLLDALEEAGLLDRLAKSAQAESSSSTLLLLCAEAAVERLRDPAQAAELLDRLLAHEPAHADGALLRARLHEAEGSFEEACALLEETSRLVRDARRRSALYLRTGKLYEEELHRNATALEQYTIAFICDPSSREAFLSLGRLYRGLRRYRDLAGIYTIALDEARQGGSPPIPHEDLLLQAAQVRIEKLGDPEGAASLIAELICRDPGEPFYVTLLLEHVRPGTGDRSVIADALRRHTERVPAAAEDPRVSAWLDGSPIR